MATKRQKRKRKKRKRSKKQKRPVQQLVTQAQAGEFDPEGQEVGESWYSATWRGTRSGARASRGFHFQDGVGAWLVARLAARELDIACLIPEGFDDLQLEGSDPTQVEVKSRQGRLGPFPVGVAARYIVEAWVRHVERFGNDRRLLLVLEQGIKGMDATAVEHMREVSIKRLVEEVDGLDEALANRLALHDLTPDTLEQFKVGTTVLGCSWEGLITATAERVGSAVALPPAALRCIGVSLRVLVADAVDANAEASFEGRVRLDRTRVVSEINAVSELIDVDSLEQALVDGACQPIDKAPITIGDAYYEGVSTQPGHVAAGLVVPRAQLTSQIMAGLEVSQAVVLAGPSGVGKSAVLWTLPFALPGVLWFRVDRIADEDIPHIKRLVRAYGASPTSPVGLLVDSAGSGELEGWSRLRRAVAPITGVLLVGAARSENLMTLGDLADCVVVRVSLEKEAAAVIHGGLVRRGATTMAHWQEAFEQSNGLTLEFTHMLTQGSRLRAVLGDQVTERIRGHRELELMILGIVSVADRWSASIPIGDLQARAGATVTELRSALERLADEHLVVERGGELSGVHRIRSRALVDIIHEIPPPVLYETAVSVLEVLRSPALSRFVYEVLRERPELEEPMLAAMEDLAQVDSDRLVGCLRGLELLDFYRRATAWVEIAQGHGVPMADRRLALQAAIAELDFPDIFPAELRSATEEMAALPKQSSTRDSLLGAVGLDAVGSELAAATTPDSCIRLLRTVGRTTIDPTPLQGALSHGSRLVGTLRGCSISELADCVASARDVSRSLARAFVDAVGGTEGVFAGLRDSDPWIRTLGVESRDDDLVGVARFLQVSDTEQGDPREHAVELGRLLLRLLPDIGRVDVKAVLPGGRSLEIDGDDHGSSGLIRRYDDHAGSIEWNRDRFRLVQTLFGASHTERLTQAAELLVDLSELILEFGNAFVQARAGPAELTTLVKRGAALETRGRSLPPRLEMAVVPGASSRGQADYLSAIVIEACRVLARLARPDGYVALSAHINQTVLGRYLPAVRDQPWTLIGLDSAPPALTDLAKRLSDLDAVVTELAADQASHRMIVNRARSGGTKNALARSADLARQRTRRRVQARRRALQARLHSTQLPVDVFWVESDPVAGNLSNFAVTVGLKSLAQWKDALERLVPRLKELREGGESPLLVPILDGRSIPMAAKRLIFELRSAADLGRFADVLPAPLEQRLTTPAIAAHNALEVWSALSILGREGDLRDEVGKFLQCTLTEYGAAIAEIRTLGADSLTEELVDWLEETRNQVEHEWTGDTEAGAFAAAIAEGTLGAGSPEASAFEGRLFLALQWDANPRTAISLLDAF